MAITAQLLRENGACKDQVDTFESERPDGAEVTLENCLRAGELGLDFEFAAYALLLPEALRVFCAATEGPLRVYRAAIEEAGPVYDAATKEAWRVYDTACATAFHAAFHAGEKEV